MERKIRTVVLADAGIVRGTQKNVRRIVSVVVAILILCAAAGIGFRIFCGEFSYWQWLYFSAAYRHDFEESSKYLYDKYKQSPSEKHWHLSYSKDNEQVFIREYGADVQQFEVESQDIARALRRLNNAGSALLPFAGNLDSIGIWQNEVRYHFTAFEELTGCITLSSSIDGSRRTFNSDDVYFLRLFGHVFGEIQRRFDVKSVWFERKYDLAINFDLSDYRAAKEDLEVLFQYFYTAAQPYVQSGQTLFASMKIYDQSDGIYYLLDDDGQLLQRMEFPSYVTESLHAVQEKGYVVPFSVLVGDGEVYLEYSYYNHYDDGELSYYHLEPSDSLVYAFDGERPALLEKMSEEPQRNKKIARNLYVTNAVQRLLYDYVNEWYS